MKRSHSQIDSTNSKVFTNLVYQHTRAKRPRLVQGLPNVYESKLWVSATKTRNYLMRDPLVDWLKLSTRREGGMAQHEIGFTGFLMERGIEFESELIKYIHREKVPVVTVSEYFTSEGVAKTTSLMKQGVPVIHSAPVHVKGDRTGGIIDLLVRSDYLGRIVNENPLTDDEQIICAPKLSGNYHYVVIDIKFSTLPLRADGRLLLNSGSYPAYKSQTWIYTKAVGQIQGYTPRYAFIMGRRWRYQSKDIKYQNFTCLDKLGVIDFQGVDMEYISRTKAAVQWYRDVQKHGVKWSVDPPSRPELYPNMCVDSGGWNEEKEKIASRIGEITKVWYLGLKHRENAMCNRITSWRDERCTSENIGMRGVRADTIDKIMAINRQSKDKLLPTKIKSNVYEWKRKSNEVYVDFETISDVFCEFNDLPKQPKTDMIFMIGVGWEETCGWQYRSFICNKATYEEENRIMGEFSRFMVERKYPKMWYWHAENQFWNSAEKRQFDMAHDTNDIERKDHISDEWTLTEWADLSQLFKIEPIVVKDCFKFGLKEVATAMRGHGMIKSKIESECNSGTTAMVKAWKCYQQEDDPVNSSVMKDIVEYNQFDVKVLWEILSYLRMNHV